MQKTTWRFPRMGLPQKWLVHKGKPFWTWMMTKGTPYCRKPPMLMIQPGKLSSEKPDSWIQEGMHIRQGYHALTVVGWSSYRMSYDASIALGVKNHQSICDAGRHLVSDLHSPDRTNSMLKSVFTFALTNQIAPPCMYPIGSMYGIFTYIETPYLWPSFVGKYSSTMDPMGM